MKFYPRKLSSNIDYYLYIQKYSTEWLILTAFQPVKDYFMHKS